MTERQVKKSLLDQLDSRNIRTKYTEDVVDDYIKHWKIKESLSKDIADRGAKIETYNAKGDLVIRSNESIADLFKEQTIMIKLLQILGLNEPVVRGSADDYL